MDSEEAERFWTYVYNDLANVMPEYDCTDLQSVEAAVPVVSAVTQTSVPHVAPRSPRSPLLPAAAGAALGMLVTVPLKTDALFQGIGVLSGALIGCALYTRTIRSGRRRPVQTSPVAAESDWSAMRQLCEARAEYATGHFDAWYRQSLRTALDVWSRRSVV